MLSVSPKEPQSGRTTPKGYPYGFDAVPKQYRQNNKTTIRAKVRRSWLVYGGYVGCLCSGSAPESNWTPWYLRISMTLPYVGASSDVHKLVLLDFDKCVSFLDLRRKPKL